MIIKRFYYIYSLKTYHKPKIFNAQNAIKKLMKYYYSASTLYINYNK